MFRKKRISVYWPGAIPGIKPDITELDNRFSTMTEVRPNRLAEFWTVEYSQENVFTGNRRNIGIVSSQYRKVPGGG